MDIILPSLEEKTKIIKDKQTIVLIGGNGSGKTRMSVWIEQNNAELNIHRISAQKSLNMPELIQPSDIEITQEKLFYGSTNDNKDWLKKQGKQYNRWQKKPNTAMLNDYTELMQYLVTEEYQKSIEFRSNHKNGNDTYDNTTKLEMIKSLWEEILIHRKLKISAGKIEVFKTEEPEGILYNGSEMSDGERAIFYFIGEALSVPNNCLVIIDEPENHLHKSLLTRLWNKIENYRQDCVFLYITHSVEFALSRISSEMVWVKDYSGENKWIYEVLDTELPENLNLELLGNRDRVLFVEGTAIKSIDFKLYSILFDDCNVIPLESCSSVIQFTKAYNGRPDLHNLEVKGIIDRDRRSEEEVEKLRSLNIYIPEVAEIESIFLLPNIIKIAMETLQIDAQIIKKTIDDVKIKSFDFLKRFKQQQAMLFMKQKIQNSMAEICDIRTESIDNYKEKFQTGISAINIQNYYDHFSSEIDRVISEENYEELLKITNNKGLLPECGLLTIIKMKKDDYINFVLRILRNPKFLDVKQELIGYIKN